jgi:hypothetical protein
VFFLLLLLPACLRADCLSSAALHAAEGYQPSLAVTQCLFWCPCCLLACRLTVSAVLLCLLLKTTNPKLAAAAAAQNRAGGSRSHMAAEVMTAARRRVGELQQQLADRVGHMGGLQGGLQALGKLRFKGWGAKPSAQQQQQQLQRGGSGGIAVDEEEGSSIGAADNAAGSLQEIVGSDQTAAAAAAAAASVRSPASLQVLLCLDTLVQRSFTMLRDQLKRRLAPLLSDCMVHPGLTEARAAAAVGVPDSLAAAAAVGAAFAGDSLAESGQFNNTSSSSNDNSRLSSSEGAGAAVAGAAAASAAEAEAALLCYRSWSEVVGVMHAAVVALRGAGVPRALTAALVQQVKCDSYITICLWAMQAVWLDA